MSDEPDARSDPAAPATRQTSVSDRCPSGDAAIARRAMLRTLGAAMAGAVAAGRAPAAQHAAGHDRSPGASPERAPGAQQPADAAGGALPRALDDHERATLAALGDRLVPGSTQAGVPDLLDRLLAVDTPEALGRFRNALGAFEGEARRRHAKAWLELPAPEQAAILTEASTTAPARRPPPPWTAGQPVVAARAAQPASPATLRDHHDYLRDAVAEVYFATEAGMTELGWTGTALWSALPGCQP